MAQSAAERVTRAYKRKHNIDGAQKELVRAHIPIIQELAATGGAMERGKDRMSKLDQSPMPPPQQA